MKQLTQRQEGAFAGLSAMLVLLTTMVDPKVPMLLAFVSLSAITFYKQSKKQKS